MLIIGKLGYRRQSLNKNNYLTSGKISVKTRKHKAIVG